MKSFNIYFSYYSEEYGQFEDKNYRIDAENQFEARQKAWEFCESDDDMKFASCIKQCGVTWDSSPLNVQEYFNAKAAVSKCRARIIENVDIPNADIENNKQKRIKAKNEISFYWGSIKTISDIAKEMGRALGLQPPDIYDELYYAEAFVNKLETGGDYSQASAFMDIIEAAKKWDENAILSITDFFRNGWITLNGELSYYGKDFSKDGIFPEKSDIWDFESQYITRWQNARHIAQLSRLRMFKEKDIIQGSESWRVKHKQMSYEYHVLILKPDVLPKELQKPENMLWTPIVEGDNVRYAENMITGEFTNLSRSDFLGVLRPEFEKNINFEALKKEYTAIHEEYQPNDDDPLPSYDQEEEDEAEY